MHRSADTLSKQQQYVQRQLSILQTDVAYFRRVYRFTFNCAKEEPAKKALDLENAIIYWTMIFSPPSFSISSPTTDWLEEWKAFLGAKWSKSVNKDMWNQTLEFFLKAKEDDKLSFWSEDSAWPGVIDEFVVWMKERRGNGAGAGTEKMETD